MESSTEIQEEAIEQLNTSSSSLESTAQKEESTEGNTDFKAKYEKSVELLQRSEAVRLLMKKRLRKLQYRLKRLEGTCKTYNEMEEKYTKILKIPFNDNQIEALNEKGYIKAWSRNTIQKALKLKFACGNNGYEELLKQKMPLPSLRTLRRHLEHLKLSGGILDEIFHLLKIKTDGFLDDRDRECMLVFDEMSITPGKAYDVCTQSYIGDITLPSNCTGAATHALVFMLGGVGSRWKQIVAYYYTGNGYDGQILKPIILQIIEKAEAIGLRVNSITSDMGSMNQALWRSFNIGAGRYSTIQNYTIHPTDPTRKLYFYADVPHVLKNLKASLPR